MELYGKPIPEESTLEEEAGLKAQTVIDSKRVKEAALILNKYKNEKANLETRIVEDELWYELRHWEALRRNRKEENKVEIEPTSAWLFNQIISKHADAMDNFPEPIVLPREASDEESAKTLSSVLPVIMETNEFEQTYNDNWWEKLKHGTGVYGIFWDPKKENGIGDVDIRSIDLLNLFWEPGIRDIQNSRNLFIVDMVDTDLLEEEYPDLKGKLSGNSINVTEYVHDDTVDTSGKTVVVDWYYKTIVGTRKTLQYCKFVNDIVLYATENIPELRERGLYDHGMYPVVLDVLYPEKGTPVGFGYVSICKDPQLYIDKMYSNVLENAILATKKRFWVSNSTGINEDEFLNTDNRLVHVEGELEERRIREIEITPPSPVVQNILHDKVEEMKETSANRDVNTGSGAGVTAASAIAALQEAGNKTSRDMISASYRCYRKMINMILEVVRQFYDISRAFRITGKAPGQYEYIQFSNARIKNQPYLDEKGMVMELYRKPVFDLKLKAQKKNPFSRMEENERAKELYGLGFFNPDRAQEALNALEMMDFEGIDKVRSQVAEGQTLLNIVKQLSMQLNMMANALGLPAKPSAPQNTVRSRAPEEMQGRKPDGSSVASGIMEARTPMTSYGQRLAKRSSPDMNEGTARPMAT